MTLVELLLAMAITGVVGASVALLLSAGLRATAGQEQARANLICQQRAVQRLEAEIRSAEMVLSAEQDCLVLWTGDRRGNEKPNRSELCRIERDPETGTLWVYRSAEGLAESDDLTYSLIDSSFGLTTRALKEQEVLVGELWATDVASLTFILDHADPRQGRLVSFRLTGTEKSNMGEMAGAAALRSR